MGSTDRSLVAGVAQVPLPLAPGIELMGYALRTGRATGTLDPLSARALYLRSTGEVLLVALDVCLVTPSQATALRQRLGERTGLAPGRIVLTCIHTHSGPDTGMAALVARRAPPPHVAALFDAAVEAGERAVQRAAPARLGLGQALLSIGRNRRAPGGALDPVARVVRVDGSDGAPLAILWLHGCHPTVLGHDNLLYSADWPGAARAAIEAAYPGALSIFLLSAHGDVDPRTRGLQDLARANRSLGASADCMRALGHEAGRAVAEAAATIPTTRDVAVEVADTRVALAVHGGADARAAAEALVLRRRQALDALGLAPDTRVRTAELYRLADERMAGLPPDEARECAARVRLFLRDRVAAEIAGGRVAAVEVQVLRIGDAVWLALPLEPTVRVGLDWSERSGSRAAAVLSIANGWLRYLPHAADFAEPRSHQGYEVLTSTFVPEAAASLLAAGEGLLRG